MWNFQRRRKALRRVVYTCLFGYSERFNDFRYDAPGIDFICFTDDPELTSDFWTIKQVPLGLLDPPRRSKQIKAKPHIFLPEYDQSIYVDNTVRITAPIADIFSTYLGAPSLPRSSSPLVCYQHPWRSCVYDEASAVLAGGYDDPARVNQQMDFYRSIGYPANNGLAKTTFLLRNHHDPALIRLMDKWHEQVLRHSFRDQLSLLPTARALDFEISYLPLKFLDHDLFQWPVVKDNKRVPRDFVDSTYLSLNPDVTGLARKHYLNFGMDEGRAYK